MEFDPNSNRNLGEDEIQEGFAKLRRAFTEPELFPPSEMKTPSYEKKKHLTKLPPKKRNDILENPPPMPPMNKRHWLDQQEAKEE